MTMSMYYKTFVWFFLIGMLEVVESTGISPNKLKVKLFEKEKSIFINGEQVNFDDWILGIIQNYDEFENDINAIKMFTFVKCECANFIQTSIESIIPSVKPCSYTEFPSTKQAEACAKINQDVIDKLKSFNVNIKLAISTLFQIVDLHPNLRSGESYFSRTLLEVSFYVESFAYIELRKDSYMLNSEKAMKILQNMKRVLLQIVNLIGQFAFEYCYPNKDNKNGIGQQDSNPQLNFVFEDLSYTSSSKWQLNMGTIMLEKCMQDNDGDKIENNALTFCNKYVKTVEITKVDKYLDDIFKAVIYSYDVKIIYDYMVSIYQVILKLIYLKTRERWTSLDEEWCERIISKLKLMHCPIDIIEHFQILLYIKRIRNVLGSAFDNIAIPYFEEKFKAVNNVKLDIYDLNDPLVTRFGDEWKQISLSDLMKNVLEDEMFEQFWLAFNFLYKDFAKKSSRTYDMSLNLLPEEIQFRNDEYKMLYEERCNKLTYFITKYLSQISPLSKNISEDLFKQLNDDLEKWEHTENNLFNIYLAARIQLENFNKLQFENGEMLMRIVNIIWNMVDNYTIQNCVDLKDQNFALKKKYDKTIEYVSQNKIYKKNKDSIFNRYLQSIGQLFCSRSKENTNVEKVTKESVYDFGKLTGKRLIEKGSVGTKVYFDWQGEKKSIMNIQTHISKNILNIQHLVDYQRLCFNMIFYVFFETWLVRFEERFQNKGIDIEAFDQSLKDLFETFNKLLIVISEVPYATYARYYRLKLDFYLFMVKRRGVNLVGSELVEVVKKEIMSPMAELLGIFVNDNHGIIADIQTFLEIKNKPWNDIKDKEYSALLSDWENKIREFNRNLRFFGPSLPIF